MIEMIGWVILAIVTGVGFIGALSVCIARFVRGDEK